MVALTLVVAGALALVYGGFSYTKRTHEARVGPLDISIAEKKQVNVPVWLGVASVVAGGGLLLGGRR